MCLQRSGLNLRGSGESPSRLNSKLPLATAVTVPCDHGGGERSIRSGCVGLKPTMLTLLQRRMTKPPSLFVNQIVTAPYPRSRGEYLRAWSVKQRNEHAPSRLLT